jgi:hypothetical protein
VWNKWRHVREIWIVSTYIQLVLLYFIS